MITRQFNYHTSDGKSFTSRLEAMRHETALRTQKRVSTFLLEQLGVADEDAKVAVREVVAAICLNPKQTVGALSARAARRAGGSKPRSRRK